jgi:hypothetical protein
MRWVVSNVLGPVHVAESPEEVGEWIGRRLAHLGATGAACDYEFRAMPVVPPEIRVNEEKR